MSGGPISDRRFTRMIPRGRLDIGWFDLLAALAACLVPGGRDRRQRRAALKFDASTPCLATLSVRSGLDLVCRVMAWPPGSEILVSAITLADMVEILGRHELVPVPVDIDPHTLAVAAGELERLVTPRTKAILIAHLFGSRMPLEEIVHVAERRQLILIEDCAQALAADDFRGHPAADVALFSFGPIKTKTALGGAIVRFRDAGLLRQVGTLQETYPVQRRWTFLRRVVTVSLLKMATSRIVFSLFVQVCSLLGVDYDQFLQRSVRGFRQGDLLSRIRRKPCAPLLALLARRLKAHDTTTILWRIIFAHRVMAALPRCCVVGSAAADHTHWVLPIRSHSPEQLVAALRQAGFDATRGASRLCAVTRDAESSPPQAAALLEQIVYLPLWPEMSDSELNRMVEVICRHVACNEQP